MLTLPRGASLVALCYLAIGCGDTATEVPPDLTMRAARPADPGNGGKTSKTVDVALQVGADGHVSSAKITKETDRALSLNSGRTYPAEITTAFTGARLSYESGECTIEGEASLGDALAAQLERTIPEARIWIVVDKANLGAASDGNHFEIAYTDDVLGGVRLGFPAQGNPPPFVVSPSTDVYEFAYGIVRVWATRGNGKEDDVKLLCDNSYIIDVVRATVIRK